MRSVGMLELVPLSRDALVDPVAPVALPVELALALLNVPRTSTWLFAYLAQVRRVATLQLVGRSGRG